MELTARISPLNRAYFVIYNHGRAWRVCHRDDMAQRYPDLVASPEDEARKDGDPLAD